MKKHNFIAVTAITLLTLTSTSSYAATGYQGGTWRTKVEFEKKAEVNQCIKVENTPNCSECVDVGSSTQSTVTGTEITINASVSAEESAGVEGSAWKFAKITGEFTASQTLGGTYKSSTTVTDTITADVGDGGCAYSLGLDEQKTSVWDENYSTVGRTFNRSKREISHAKKVSGRACDWDGSLPVAVYKHGTIYADGTGGPGQTGEGGW